MVWLLAVMDPHVAFEMVRVARGKGAQRTGVKFRGGVRNAAGFVYVSPLPFGAAAKGSIGQVGTLQLRRVDGGAMLEALLTGETIKLCP